MTPEIKIIFAVIATIIGTTGSGYYIYEMFKRKTEPHLFTWVIWCITQGIAVAGAWYGNGGWGTASLFIGFLFCLAITLLTFKFGTKNIKTSDYVLFTTALLAIFVWWKLENPILAVFMASGIDAFGYFPTWRKSITEPFTENPWAWFSFGVATLFAIFALKEYNFLTLTYLITISIANFATYAICLYFRKF